MDVGNPWASGVCKYLEKYFKVYWVQKIRVKNETIQSKRDFTNCMSYVYKDVIYLQ